MESSAPRTTLTVFRIAAACTIAAVALGSVVCATESGFECGNWPGCQTGALLPDNGLSAALYRNPWIEMIHRTSAILAGPFALASTVLSLRLRNVPSAVKILPWITVLGAIVAGYVGRGIVLGVTFPAWVSAADLGSAVVAMAAIVTATVLLERPRRPAASGRVAGWSWLGFGSALAMHLTSLYAAGAGSYTRCMSWPVATILQADTGTPVGLHAVRFGLAAVAGAAVVVAVLTARRHPELRPTATAVGVAFALVLAFIGAIRISGDTDLGLWFSLASVGLLVGLVLLGARAASAVGPVGGAGSRPRADVAGVATP